MALSAITVHRDTEKVTAFITGPLFFGLGVGLAATHGKVTDVYKSTIAPGFLKLIYGSDAYDEALLRSYRDSFNKRLQQLILLLMDVSCMSMLFFTLFTNFQKSDWYYTMLVSLFYTPIFHHRLGKAMDPWSTQFDKKNGYGLMNMSNKKTKYGQLARNLYLFYPFLDEHSDFQRSQAMRVSKSLERKRWVLSTAKYQQLLLLLISNCVLASIAWCANQNVPKRLPRIWKVWITAFAFTYADYVRLGPYNLIDKFNQYVAIEAFDRPVASIQYPNFFSAGESSFAGITSQNIAHYNQNLGPLKPLAQFWHKKGFAKFREQGYSLGTSMVYTTALRCAVVLGMIALTASPNHKQTLPTILLVTTNYFVHAVYQYLDADELLVFKYSRDNKRHDPTRQFNFGLYRIITGIFDFFFFACPMVNYMLMKFP